ncbi:hypothetical protein NBCG_02262 [Nocardioidaceae bacterium Broad-1]|nr:hypothetical protein NBCG_02262 [Nocardioidaceae bacterium Broad-1]
MCGLDESLPRLRVRLLARDPAHGPDLTSQTYRRYSNTVSIRIMTQRRSLAIGCGGTLGFAWTAVALRALEEALDWDARTADVLVGTSAGSEIVAALGSGRTPQDLLDALDGTPGADPVLAAHVAVHPGTVPPVPAPALPGGSP